MAQMGFFDLSDRYSSLDAKKDPLVKIDVDVPWEEFCPQNQRAASLAPICVPHAILAGPRAHKAVPSLTIT